MKLPKRPPEFYTRFEVFYEVVTAQAATKNELDGFRRVRNTVLGAGIGALPDGASGGAGAASIGAVVGAVAGPLGALAGAGLGAGAAWLLAGRIFSPDGTESATCEEHARERERMRRYEALFSGVIEENQGRRLKGVETKRTVEFLAETLASEVAREYATGAARGRKSQ